MVNSLINRSELLRRIVGKLLQEYELQEAEDEKAEQELG